MSARLDAVRKLLALHDLDAILVWNLTNVRYLSGFTGLIMGLTFIPIYLQTVLIWSGWLAFLMLRRAALPVQAA